MGLTKMSFMPRVHFVAALLLCVFVAIGSAPNTTNRSSASEKSNSAVRIALCQTLCIESDKEGNLRRIEYALELAAEMDAHIACFGETALLGWINPEAHDLADPIPGPTTDRLCELAAKHGLMLSIGLCEKDGDKLYDSAVLINAEGHLISKHRKCNILTELMDPPYTPGDPEAVQIVDTEHGRIGMLVCADTFQDDLVERVRSQQPDLLLVPYGWAAPKDAWPDHGKSLSQWIASTARRAECVVIGTDIVGHISQGPWDGYVYGGQSAAVTNTGVRLAHLKDRDPDVVMIELQITHK
jgi:predicted amidohydrolase